MDSKQNRDWHKSSYSGNNGGNCVEVAEGETNLIRDTQSRDRGYLVFTPLSFAVFLQSVKAEEL